MVNLHTIDQCIPHGYFKKREIPSCICVAWNAKPNYIPSL